MTHSRIEAATDLWGDRHEVHEWRKTLHGFALALGWPDGAVKGKGGAGGPRVILTSHLAAYFEDHRRCPSLIVLPIGKTSIKRVRRLLGHNWHDDNADWWLERLDDLADLTLDEFARRHHVAPPGGMRIALLGHTQRPAGWWRGRPYADLLTADLPRVTIADQLGISVGAVGRLRWTLKLGISSPSRPLESP